MIERTAFVVLPFLFTLSLSCQLHKCLRIVWCIHYPFLSSVSLCSIWLFKSDIFIYRLSILIVYTLLVIIVNANI